MKINVYLEPLEIRRKRFVPEKLKLPNTSRFKKVDEDSKSINETNDCSVKAMAILLELPYGTCHRLFKHAGREFRKPTHYKVTPEAYKLAGYRLVTFSLSSVIPPNGKSATTYQPQRYPELWEPYKNTPILFHSQTHAVAWKNGRMNCWAQNRALRIVTGYTLEQIK